MGDLAAVAIVLGPVLVLVGLAAAFQRLAYRRLTGGHTWGEDERESLLANAERVLGLARVGAASGSRSDPAVLQGEVRGHRVRVEETPGGRKLMVTLVAAGGHELRGLPGVDIGPRDAAPGTVGVAPRGVALSTGDPEFDREVWLSGDPAAAGALMDQPTRRAMLAYVLERGLLCRAGSCAIEVPGHLAEPQRVKAEIHQLVGVLATLSVPRAEIEPRLVRNALHDPVPRVRLRAIDLLATRAALHPDSRNALRSVVGGSDPEARFRAAAGLGEEGLATIEELALRPDPGDELALRALALFVASAPEERTLRLLRTLVTGPHGPRRLKAFGELHRLGRLTERDAIAALGSVDRGMRLTAAAALGATGTAAAVPALHALAASEPTLDLELRRAARDAIARIQARLTGAEPGQVALAPGEGAAGRVGLADEERRGRVALPENGA